MRLKRGSRVEVFSKREVPSGSWQCAEIICGNGHTYTVRYDISGGATVVEKVSRKAIRPSPLPAKVLENWAPGDLVEVFHDCAWRLAMIWEFFGKKYVLVRLIGSSREVKVSKFDVRGRRWWQDDQWVDFGKGSKNYENGNLILDASQHLNLKIKKTNTRMHPCVKIKGPRASPYCTLRNERIRRHAIGSTNRAELAEQVDIASINIRINQTRKQNGVVAVNLVSNDAVSVASCSVNNAYDSQMVHLDSGDAESFCESRYDNRNRNGFRKDELASEIHKLELNAYRRTMGALHASGPLSWEQEEMMTNLRLSLHISNDEHLIELRNLVPADTSVNFR